MKFVFCEKRLLNRSNNPCSRHRHLVIFSRSFNVTSNYRNWNSSRGGSDGRYHARGADSRSHNSFRLPTKYAKNRAILPPSLIHADPLPRSIFSPERVTRQRYEVFRVVRAVRATHAVSARRKLRERAQKSRTRYTYTDTGAAYRGGGKSHARV